MLSLRTLTPLVAIFLAAVIPIAMATLERPVRFEHHQLVRLPRNNVLLDKAYALGLDVWAKAASHIDVRVAPGQLDKWRKSVGPSFPTNVKVLHANVQEIIDDETAMLRSQALESAAVSVDDTFFKAFHRYAEVVEFMRALAEQYPKLVTFVPSIGKTSEGRDMAMIRVTSSTGDKAAKKRVWLNAQQHAREWIAGVSILFTAYAMASRYEKDERIKAVLDKVEFVVVPMCNPDGIEYSWDTNRLWRKSRATIKGQKAGVDLNRNWPDHWGTGGSSSSPSSDTYMGPSAGSEPEVKALMAAFQATPNIIAACDFHSYSELILRPYGWTRNNGPDDAAFTRLGDNIKRAIQSKGEGAYTNQRIVDLYVASGGASDWYYGLGTRTGNSKVYGISIELPPSQADGGWGGQGFIIKPERIIPVGESMVEAVLTMAEYGLANPLGKQA